MRQRLVQALCVALLVGGSACIAGAQSQLPQQPASGGIFLSVRQPVVNATNAIRLINDAEFAYRSYHRRFGSWQELYDSGALWEAQKTIEDWRKVAFATGPAALPGYHLSLLVSADGSEYSISLRDIASDGCGRSLFSDQKGFIYHGTPLDCPAPSDLPRNR
jgi:hypothetical protein